MVNKQQKKVFSVAGKYSKVLDILQSVDNQSEFICQAIIEKHEGRQDRSVTDKELDQRIRAILAEMVTDDCVIIAHKGEVPTTKDIPISVKPEPVKSSEPQDDDASLIKDIVGKW